MVVQAEGGTVKAHRRLARPGTALNREELGPWGAVDLVLLRLNSGDDVEHLAGSGAFKLGEERIATP